MSHKELKKKYKILQELGTGAFSSVKLGVDRDSGDEVAIKCIKKDMLKMQHDRDNLFNEVNLLKDINHPNVVQLIEFSESADYYYIVMECMAGGELFDRIVDKGFYSEKDAATVVYKIARALAWLHGQGIIHRDLKPENLLYANDQEDAEIKIADFGFATMLDEGSFTKTILGTPQYLAPEILKAHKASSKGYAGTVDMWSLGVIAYILLCGFPPFYETNQALLFQSILAADYEFLEPYWDDVSKSAKDFVSSLLVVDTEKRLTAEQAMEHPWIVAHADAPDINLPGTLSNLKTFNAKRKFRKASYGVIATLKFKNLFAKRQESELDLVSVAKKAIDTAKNEGESAVENDAKLEGFALFQDVFRKADKNDDGTLERDEFSDYFRDNVMTKYDLDNLFDTIDKDGGRTIDSEELQTFFLQGLPPYVDVYLSLELMHKSLLGVLHSTAKSYDDEDMFSQFRTRYYFREAIKQLKNIYQPLEIALDHLETTSAENRPPQESNEAVMSRMEQNSRRSAKSSTLAVRTDAVDRYVGQLKRTLDTLDRALFGTFSLDLDGSSADIDEYGTVQLLTRTCLVADGFVDEFKTAVAEHFTAIRGTRQVLHTFLKPDAEHSHVFYIYIVFISERAQAAYYRTSAYKDHAVTMLDVLAQPEKATTVPCPSSWFPYA